MSRDRLVWSSGGVRRAAAAALLVAAPVVLSAQAAPTAPASASSPPAIRPLESELELVLPPALYSQTDYDSGEGAASQNFEPSLDGYDCQAADDFEVPPGSRWTIIALGIPGSYSDSGPLSSVDVFIHRQSSGGDAEPAGLVASQAGIVPSSDVAGDLIVFLSPHVELTQGVYWLSVRANLNFLTAGQWYWSARTVQAGTKYVWRNPGDAFGSGCTDWTTGASCVGLVFPDLLFALYGNEASDPCNSGAQLFDMVPPDGGWSVVNSYPSGPAWHTRAYWGYPNWTGGSGEAATVSSDVFGPEAFDTELRSPDFAIVGYPAAEARFKVNYQNFGLDRLDFDISANDFASSTTLLSLTGDVGAFESTPGGVAIVDLTSYAGQSGLRARWRYWNHQSEAWDWYAQIDNVELRCGVFFDSFEVNTSRWSYHTP